MSSVRTPGSRKSIWLWVLFDFANSLASISVAFYFSLWLVQDNKVSDIWITIPIVVSTLLLFITLPFFGGISDRIQKRMPFLRVFTLLSIVSLFFLGLVAVTNTSFTSSTLLLITILYFLFQYSYLASFSFYNSFIHDLSTSRTKEKISGLGLAAGQLGNVVGLLLILPVAQGKIPIFGATGREATFLVASLLFLIFSLPVLIFLKDKKREVTAQPVEPKGRTFGGSFKDVLRDLYEIRKYPGVLMYLITYYFFADAILTLNLFVSLYMEKVGGLGDKQKTFAAIIGLAAAVLGALLSPLLARRLKSTRLAIATLIGSWAVFIAIFAFSTNQILFMVMLALNGFAFGALFSLSRAFFSYLVPENEQGKFFGVYTLFERFASVLGPLLWSGTILAFASFGEVIKYRFAMLSLALLVAISFFTFRFVKEPQKINVEKIPEE